MESASSSSRNNRAYLDLWSPDFDLEFRLKSEPLSLSDPWLLRINKFGVKVVEKLSYEHVHLREVPAYIASTTHTKLSIYIPCL
jgi:hypothetical protein